MLEQALHATITCASGSGLLTPDKSSGDQYYCQINISPTVAQSLYFRNMYAQNLREALFEWPNSMANVCDLVALSRTEQMPLFSPSAK